MHRTSLAAALLVAGVWAGMSTAAQNAVVREPGEAAVGQLTPPFSARAIVQAVAKLLPARHLSAHAMDGEMAQRTLVLFLGQLDPNKAYFYEADVEGFRRRSEDLAGQLADGDASLAFEVFNLWRQRLGERIALAQKWLEADHDFTIDEPWVLKAEAASYPAHQQQAVEVWRKRVKYELLRRKVEGVDLDEARRRIARQFRALQRRYEQADADEVLEWFLGCLTGAYDPVSSYLSVRARANQQIDMKKQLFGIGASLEMSDGQLIVKQVIPGGPAARDGRLRPGDHIVAVGQGANEPFVEVGEMRLAEAVDLIRGQQGTTVRLRVLPPTGQFDSTVFALTRDKVDVARLVSTILTGEQLPDGRAAQIGYLYMPSFYTDVAAEEAGQKDFRSSARDTRRLLDGFRARGVDLVLVDLRNNSGGSLGEALRTAALFLGPGTVVQSRVRGGQVFPHNTPEASIAWDGPLVVLANRQTAGGAEMLVGAVQDYQRGLVLGDRSTQGLGLIRTSFDVRQTLYPGENSPDLGFLLLTTAQLYRSSGEGIQGRGIEPHVVLPSLTSLAPVSSSRPYALQYDAIGATQYQAFEPPVSAELRESLAARSAARQQKSAYFQQLTDRLARAEQAEELTHVSLKEELFRAQFPPSPQQKPAPKMPGIPELEMDGYVQEVLSIALDYAGRTISAQAEKSWSAGEYARAIELHRKAVGADPQNAAAHYLLGWALATCPEKAIRDGRTAVEHARRACELDGQKTWSYLLGLAVAEAEAGSFEEAQKHLREALEKAPADEREPYRALEARFKAGQPFQDR